MILGLPWSEYAVRPWLGSSALDDWRPMGREAWADKWLSERGEGYSGDGGSPAMVAGSALDCLLTGTEMEFEARFAVKPEGMKLSTKDGIAWAAQVGNRAILDAVTHAEVLAALPRAREALQVIPPEPEDPVFQVTLRGTVEGMQIQTRPDIWFPKANQMPDLKYVNAKSFDDFDRHFWPGRYAIQAGLAYGLTPDPKPTVSFLLVESGTMFPRVRVVMIQEWIAAACWREAQKRCKEIHEAIEGAAMIDRVRFDSLNLPAWAEKEMG